MNNEELDKVRILLTDIDNVALLHAALTAYQEDPEQQERKKKLLDRLKRLLS